MKKLLLPLVFLVSLCCGVSAWGQGIPNFGAVGVPNAAPFVGYSVLAKSGTAASVTGTLTETTLATIAIPANAISANGQIRITTFWTVTNSANAKVGRVRLGGLSGSVLLSDSVTTIANFYMFGTMTAANSTSSQLTQGAAARGTDGLYTTITNTSAIDMTTSQNLVITAQLANTGETITLSGYTVEYIN